MPKPRNNIEVQKLDNMLQKPKLKKVLQQLTVLREVKEVKGKSNKKDLHFICFCIKKIKTSTFRDRGFFIKNDLLEITPHPSKDLISRLIH